MFRVAIVGRPNVGKSTLFNRLGRTRKALVGDEPGITRDRIFQIVTWAGKQFELIDTGGIDPGDKEIIPEKVLEQAEVAMQDADLILLLVDVRSGMLPLDQEVATLLKSKGKELLVVVNKVDVDAVVPDTYQFHALGVDQVIPLSAEHKLGVDDLLNEILDRVPEGEAVREENEIRVAIIGRPNVGKSSIVNRLLGTDRVIVSNVPGTTRDSVDSFLTHGGQNYRIVDTAGIRRKGKTTMMAEKLSVVMARKNMEQADVAILVIDAEEGATKLDATIAGYASELGKPVVIAVNKWDLVEKDTHTAHQVEKVFRQRMRYLDYAPLVFVSALEGQRIFKLLDFVKDAYAGSLIKISTAEVNHFLTKEIRPSLLNQGGASKSRLKYACQVGVAPPTFVLFLRGSEKLHFSTERHLINRLREVYGFYASPIRIIQRPAKSWEKQRKHLSS